MESFTHYLVVFVGCFVDVDIVVAAIVLDIVVSSKSFYAYICCCPFNVL